MYVAVSRKVYKGKVHEYLQLCESVRVDGKSRRHVILNLGRKDEIDPERVDEILEALAPFASPEVQLELQERGASFESAKSVGAVLAIRHVWNDLGLPNLLGDVPGLNDAIFRLVTSRLLEPQSKLATAEWQHEDVAWPEGEAPTYKQMLHAMDVLAKRKEAVEEAVFHRVRDLFSVPLQLVWYDVTSSYFEGDGVCSLAEFGHSRDHRPDRRQITLGLTMTQDGFPISHEVWRGNRADVTTVAETALSLKRRFGIQDIVVVADRGMLSDSNIATLERHGFNYVMALRTHQHKAVGPAIESARARGLARPRDPDAAWSVVEVSADGPQRQVVVYSAFRALHDRQVRGRRIRRTMEKLSALRAAVASGRMWGERAITARAERILREGKAHRYLKWTLSGKHFEVSLDWEQLRSSCRRDGIFVLVTNDLSMSTDRVVQAYRQLYEIENAFREIKSLTKLRPMYHHAARRVRAHVFLCVLAYLIANVMTQHLARKGLPMTANRMLKELNRIHAVEYSTAKVRATQLTVVAGEAKQILTALGVTPPKFLAFKHLPPEAKPHAA